MGQLMKALVAEGLYHSYGKGAARTEVLRDFSLSVDEGEFVALMGPSGSGKSTFLHLASGLVAPEAGRIFLGSGEVTALGDGAASRLRRRRIGMVFQDFNLIDSLSAAENIVLPARLDHKRPDLGRLASLIKRLGLGGKENRRPEALSGGERQRVAIARALYPRPAIILADEPTGNLDIHCAKEICALLASLNETERCAILLVTHDPVVAAAASRVCFLKDGRVAADFPSGHDAALVSRRYLETYK